MHPRNPYADRYDLARLSKEHTALQKHLATNPKGEQTIDFSDSQAVFHLNKALLVADFGLTDYMLPTGYLIPPVPGRLDYLLHLNEFLKAQFGIHAKARLKGLDVGCGANAIYCILGAQHFKWSMVGAESDADAQGIAKANLGLTPGLSDSIELRLQQNKSFLFKHIIKPGEYFDFTLCNPPFYASKEEATKASLAKQKNLGLARSSGEFAQNFAGQANELWCNGGEALFVKRLIKESRQFKKQVRVFSSLVAHSANLPLLEKQLQKSGATYKLIPMELGNKKSRVVCWWFD